MAGAGGRAGAAVAHGGPPAPPRRGAAWDTAGVRVGRHRQLFEGLIADAAARNPRSFDAPDGAPPSVWARRYAAVDAGADGTEVLVVVRRQGGQIVIERVETRVPSTDPEERAAVVAAGEIVRAARNDRREEGR